ncbi:hypothetical protein [Adhaeribacter terreus]|uniref:Uncharacterized protein n=1 Tax=Adhaeribacter terreus TaxID=529703 RepID=A0ABW0EAC1_9BACT
MLRKLATYLLIFATTCNVAGFYAAAATLNAASFSVCQITVEPGAKAETTVKKASTDVVIVTTPLIKEGEDKSLKFNLDFDYALTEIPYFLPVLRAGPSANYVNLYALAKGKNAPLFLLNCNFRI